MYRIILLCCLSSVSHAAAATEFIRICNNGDAAGQASVPPSRNRANGRTTGVAANSATTGLLWSIQSLHGTWAAANPISAANTECRGALRPGPAGWRRRREPSCCRCSARSKAG